MKKIIYICFAALIGLSACGEADSVLLDESQEYFAFTAKSLTVMEDGSAVTATVEWAKVTPRAGNLELEIVVAGLEKPAVEGTDYTISSKTVSFESGEYSKTITITPIDNSAMAGNKMFIIKMKNTNVSSKFGSSGDENNQIRVTIIDDEGALELADILGTYAQVDYLNSTGAPEYAPYLMGIAATSNPNEVTLVNFWGEGKDIIAEIDLITYSIAIPPGQLIYVDGTYGNCLAVYYSEGYYYPNEKIPGSISLDGSTITIGNPAEKIGWQPRVSAGSFATYSHSVLTKQ